MHGFQFTCVRNVTLYLSYHVGDRPYRKCCASQFALGCLGLALLQDFWVEKFKKKEEFLFFIVWLRWFFFHFSPHFSFSSISPSTTSLQIFIIVTISSIIFPQNCTCIIFLHQSRQQFHFKILNLLILSTITSWTILIN